MGIKRYVEGQGWVEIASASSSGKATQVSVTDSDELFESEDVEGVLTELAYSIKDIKIRVTEVAPKPSGTQTGEPGQTLVDDEEGDIIITPGEDSVLIGRIVGEVEIVKIKPPITGDVTGATVFISFQLLVVS